MPGVAVYGAVLLGLLFAYALNLHMRGRLTPVLDGLIGIVCMGMLVVSFYLFGWRIGIVMIILTIIAVPITKALAAPLAYRIHGYRTGPDPTWAEPAVLTEDLLSDDWMERAERSEMKLKARLARLARKPQIARLLQENTVNDEEYLALYWLLMKNALPDLTWDILGHPEKLQTLIDLKRRDAAPHEFSAAFREYKTQSVVDKPRAACEEEEHHIPPSPASPSGQDLFQRAKDAPTSYRVLMDGLQRRLQRKHPHLLQLPHWSSFVQTATTAGCFSLALYLHRDVPEADRTPLEMAMRNTLRRRFPDSESLYEDCYHFVTDMLSAIPRAERRKFTLLLAATWVLTAVGGGQAIADQDHIMAELAQIYENEARAFWKQ